MTNELLLYKGYEHLPAIPGVRPGMLAISVDGEVEYPELYRQMVEQIGEEQTKELFVCVEWVNDNMSSFWRHKTNQPNPTNGYYFKSRFEPASRIKA